MAEQSFRQFLAGTCKPGNERQTAKYPTTGKRKTCGNRGKGGKRRLPRAYLHNTIDLS